MAAESEPKKSHHSFKALTENTLVPLSLVTLIITVVWLAAHVNFQSEANADSIKELKAKQSAIDDIKTDIAVIKTKLENIENKMP